MDNLLALVIGIASSLVATAIFIGIVELTRRVLLPWYADHIYRGVRLDGKWECCRYGDLELPTENAPRNEVELEQKGDQVTGLTFLQDKDEPTLTVYRLRGQIRDGYFNATLWPNASDTVDAATCLFRVFHEGSKLRMKGLHTYVGSRTAEVKVTSEKMEYSKTNSNTMFK